MNQHQHAHQFFRQALEHLQTFESNLDEPDIEHLKHAAEALLKSVRLDSSSIRPYVCLAYICYLLQDRETATEYLALAEGLDPEFPPLVRLKVEMGV